MPLSLDVAKGHLNVQTYGFSFLKIGRKQYDEKTFPIWMREQDLNLRPLAYEASELTRLLYPAIWCHAVFVQFGETPDFHRIFAKIMGTDWI